MNLKNNHVLKGILIGIMIVVILTIIVLIYMVNKMKEDLLFNPIKRDADHNLRIQKHVMNKIIKNKNYLTIKNNFINIEKDRININIIKNLNTDKWIFYCHGNSGDMYTTYKYFEELSKIASIFTFDYRGYGVSSNKPSVKNIKEDVVFAWNHLINNLKVDSSKVIIMGLSLGGAIVIYLGEYLSLNNRKLPKALISESSFSSVIDIAKYRYPMICKLSLFLSESFNSYKSLKNIDSKVKVLIAHSREDDYIPIEQAQKLLKARDNMNFFKLYGEHDRHSINNDYLNIIKNLY
jgi:uncharacterized protein